MQSLRSSSRRRAHAPIIGSLCLLLMVVAAPRWARAEERPESPPERARYIPKTAPVGETDYGTPPVDANGPPPPGYRRKTTGGRGLIIAGAVTLGSLYVLTVSVGLLDGLSAMVQNMDPPPASERSSSKRAEGPSGWYLMPVVGAFVEGAQRRGSEGYVVLGVGQLLGAGLLVAGVASTKSTWVPAPAGYAVRVTPLVGHQTGLALTGSF